MQLVSFVVVAVASTCTCEQNDSSCGTFDTVSKRVAVKRRLQTADYGMGTLALSKFKDMRTFGLL